ncbi:MAG: EI24 domain-containing protein [Vicinamibacteria bacterium]
MLKELDAPGLVRRTAAGAWHIPGGVAFLARRPALWGSALLPAALCAALVVAGVVLGLYVGPTVTGVIERSAAGLPDWLGLSVALAVWIATLAAGAILGLAVALVLSAPLLERLSRQVETAARGSAMGGTPSGLRWEIAQSLRSAAYFALRMPGILVVGLVPILGPGLSWLWAAHALAIQTTDAALSRRGLDFAARRAWHRRYRPESLGLGFASLICLFIPCAALLVAPALVTGGTLLVLDLTEPAP